MEDNYKDSYNTYKKYLAISVKSIHLEFLTIKHIKDMLTLLKKPSKIIKEIQIKKQFL